MRNNSCRYSSIASLKTISFDFSKMIPKPDYPQLALTRENLKLYRKITAGPYDYLALLSVCVMDLVKTN